MSMDAKKWQTLTACQRKKIAQKWDIQKIWGQVLTFDKRNFR